MSDAPAPAKPEAPGRARAWPLWLILGISAAPVVAAWLAYFVWPPATRVNYGELIPALPLPDPPLRTADGRGFRISELRGKWVLVHLDSGRCDERCRTKLLYMRQLRLAQGRESGRVERLWITTDAAPVDPQLQREYEGTHIARGAGAALLAEFAAPRRPADHIYLIDPLGNVMLRFPADGDPAAMRKDLARLLRVSRIG